MPKKKSKNPSAELPLREALSKEPSPIQEDASVRDAAHAMRNVNADTLPVAAGEKVVGRTKSPNPDREVARFGHDPAEIRVKDQMSDEILYCFEDESQGAAIRLMKERGIKHLPVVDRSMRIVGVVSLDTLERGASDEAIAVKKPAQKLKAKA